MAMTTNRNTNFTYMKEGVASAVSNQFIRFVDKTPRRVLQDSIVLISEFEQAQKEVREKESDTDIRLNLLIDATPDATMKIIMDPIAGDYISGKGTGNIRTEFYNKGDVKMFGSYRISQGVYKFSLQEVIRKDFIIKDGSTITFNGPPLDTLPAGYRQVLYPGECGCHRQLQHDVERTVFHPVRTVEQCAFTDYRQQQLELRHELQYRRKRLDRHGIRDNALRATAEQPPAYQR